MEESRKDNAGKYAREFVEAVLRTLREHGIWEAVERYGVPYETVKYWRGLERKRERLESGARAERGAGENQGVAAGAAQAGGGEPPPAWASEASPPPPV